MDDSLKKIAELAYQRFRDGWATGNWEPYIEMLADDFTFQFPAGPFKGRHLPPDGKRLMTEWARGYAKSGDRINIQPNLKLFSDDWGIFCENGSGIEGGLTYKGTEAIFIRVRGDKVIEYREFIGDITDWVRLNEKT
jgi:ketosteroid isomerase-like protein